jgi:hypothetical protein
MSTDDRTLHGSDNGERFEDTGFGRITWVGDNVLVETQPVDVGTDKYKGFSEKREFGALAL